MSLIRNNSLEVQVDHEKIENFHQVDYLLSRVFLSSKLWTIVYFNSRLDFQGVFWMVGNFRPPKFFSAKALKNDGWKSTFLWGKWVTGGEISPIAYKWSYGPPTYNFYGPPPC